jgi:glycosyltransferase involved in cell wall biosynthesis
MNATHVRPRVWLAANTSWYLHNFRTALIDELLRRGFDVGVVAPPDAYTARLREAGARHYGIPVDGAGMNPVTELLLVLRMVRLLARERPHALLTFTPKLNIYGGLAASLVGIPYIPDISGLGSSHLRGGWLGRLMRVLYRLSMARASFIYFENDDDRQLFLDSGTARREASETLPGAGVDVDRFAPACVARNAADPFVFLMVARLLRDKGVIEFVEAARLVRREVGHVRFVIVGDLAAQNISAISRHDVDAWVRDGVIEHADHTDDILAHYSNADCVVLPSYREGTSRVLLEAASMGIPVITTDVPGCRNVVDAGVTGLLCQPRDVTSLAAAMRQMLGLTAAQRGAMGAAAREKMLREFDEKLVVRRFVERVVGIVARPESATGERMSRDSA